MDSQATNVIGVSFERRDFFVGVVVEDSQLEVVRARDKPVLPWNESYTSYGDLGNFKGFYDCSCFMVVDVDGAVVETGEHPRLRGVEVDTLDTVGAGE